MVSKKRIVIILVLVLCFIIVASSRIIYATDEIHILPPGLDEFDIRILNNGQYIESKIKPVEIDPDETLIAKEKYNILSPLRLILESGGYHLEWFNTGYVEITKGDENYKLDTNKSKYKLENKSGTIMIDHNYFEEIEGLDVSYDVLTRTLVVKSEYKDGDVYDYDLGKRTMRTSLNRDLTYTLNGGMVVPETKKNPLVIVMHGSHGGTKSEENRFDLGYSYLLKELVKEDYFVISPNVTIQYSFEDGEPVLDERLLHIFEETLKSLIEANKGSKNFGMDLKDKIDFENVILIGHSRSGYEAFQINSKYRDDKRIDIKGIVSLAPAELEKIDYNKEDIPVSIILPELDGDVKDLDGQSIFDSLMDDPKRESKAQLVYLYGANHNAFNEGLLIQDQGKPFYEGQIDKIKAEDQRSFLVAYSKAYIKSVLDGKFIPVELKLKNNKLLAYDALVSNYIPGYDIYKAKEGLDKLETDNMEASVEKAGFNAELNTLGLFNHPGNIETYDLLRLRWKTKGAEVKFRVDKTTKDKKFLSLYIAQDSTDIINSKKNQSFSLELKDKDGKISSALLDSSTPALKYVDGEPVFDGQFYSSHTPLSTLDIDLEEFKNIDRDNIKEVILKMDQNSQGSIIIKSISFN